MISTASLQRLLGIKASETSTVRLFLLHNFLLGIGSILVYVAANVLLLEHDPERSLPLGYVAGAGAVMAVGKAYTYFEHHYLLKKLAVRVLLAVVALTGVLGVLVVLGHSVAAAVAIMAGYRVIYLLTNLEFWGVSAVVFDVRQSKRLFSIISSGDMPAKALGAVLAALIHGEAQLPVLLGVAFIAYLGALFALRATLGSHVVEALARPVRAPQRQAGQLARQLFGGSELVLAMCLSLLAIAAALTGVEYMFFVNVKHKFHDSATTTQSVGWILALTYLAAMFFKLLVSRQALERYGVQWSLRLLPLVALGCLLGFGFSQTVISSSPTGLLVYFCGLYLLLEVLRRSVFDPVFLVLFQPLAPRQRLAAHTLAKGFYEPLGMGLTGLLFFAFSSTGLLGGWLPLAWMGALLLLALWFLRRTYLSYLAELKEGLGQRFAETAELALPDVALQVVLAHLLSLRPTEVLNAMAWLRQRDPKALAAHAPALLEHADERVRLALLGTAEVQPLPAEALLALAQRDPAPAVRQAASHLLATADPATPAVAGLLASPDLAARQGAIRGCLETQPRHETAHDSLQRLLAAPNPATSRTALALLPFFSFETQNQLVDHHLGGPDPGLASAALAAIGTLPHTRLAFHLPPALGEKQRWQAAADSLVALGPAVVPLVREALHHPPGPTHLHRLATVLERLGTPASRAALVALAQGPNLFSRGVALRALRRFAAVPAEAPIFEHLLRDEFALAAQLLAGRAADLQPALHTAVGYELLLLHQRVFGLLAQLYDAELVATAQRNVAHAARERQANALEILDNLIPRPIYQSLQALLDDSPVAEKARLFASLAAAPVAAVQHHTLVAMGAAAAAGSAMAPPPHPHHYAPLPTPEPLPTLLLRHGHKAFTSWTLSQALRHWQPTEPDALTLLRPYCTSPYLLLRESAGVAARALAAQQGLSLSDLQLPPAMSQAHATSEARISALERVVVLKSTALFATTPENVLSSIVPIMKEVTFREGEEIFAKGDLGNSLFIVHDGQVGIFNGPQQLATFGPGDFFGELALLDAEPRSATAAALSEVLTFRIDQEDFYDVMEERGEVLRNILRMLCQRIRAQNEKMRALAG